MWACVCECVFECICICVCLCACLWRWEGWVLLIFFSWFYLLFLFSVVVFATLLYEKRHTNKDWFDLIWWNKLHGVSQLNLPEPGGLMKLGVFVMHVSVCNFGTTLVLNIAPAFAKSMSVLWLIYSHDFIQQCMEKHRTGQLQLAVFFPSRYTK